MLLVDTWDQKLNVGNSCPGLVEARDSKFTIAQSVHLSSDPFENDPRAMYGSE